jgi:hypothetical protein
MRVLLQGFYKLPPNDAVPSPADGKPDVAWRWDHLASQAQALSLAGFTAAVWLQVNPMVPRSKSRSAKEKWDGVLPGGPEV